MIKNKISIVMPSYNCAQYISETIDSIRAQTYTNWELIIVDDCSTDNTNDIVHSYIKQDCRIQYCRLDKNSGAAVARTEAMKRADGEFIAFCDSDDLWMPTKLEEQLDFMKQNSYAFTCTYYEQITENSSSTRETILSPEKIDYERLLLDCPVGNSTVMYDVSKMGKFEVPNIRKRNDDALWLKMLKKEEYIYALPKVLVQYRIRSGSISCNKFSLIKYHWILYRDIEHLSILKSIYHILYWCCIKILKIK